jgi:hypothetical protein
VRSDWAPNFVVLLFQNLQVLFCILLIWYARRDFDELKAVVRFGILSSAVITAFFALRNVREGSIFLFGMDDKTHAAVLLCMQAYVLVRYIDRPMDCLVGLALYVASFLTISRLPIFFLPAILLALMSRSRGGVALAGLAACVIAVLLVTAGDAVMKVFGVLERLSSVEAITGEGSTRAHMLLLQIALDMKLSDPWTFFFGIGPNNFSQALASDAEAIALMQSVDPAVAAYAFEGRAPLHSTLMQLLLDYNLVVFLLIVYVLLRIAARLLRDHAYVELVFLAGLAMAGVFYTLHNKPYFFVYATAIWISGTAKHERARAAGSNRRAAVQPPAPASSEA